MDWKNKEEVRKYNNLRAKEWRKKNPEKVKMFLNRWREKNKIKIKEDRKKHYIKNKEKENKMNKEYRINNQEKVKNMIKEYRKNNKEKVAFWEKEYLKRNRKKHNARSLAYRNIPLKYGKLCECCEENFAEHRHHEDYNKPLEVKFVCKSCHNKITNLQLNKS